jgi:hypothetical protein
MQAISLTTTKQYYKLVDDIDMTSVSWTSLNAEGTKIIDLNGNSKKISNMRAPLFADLNGNIYNLTLYNSVISSTGTVGILANTCNTAASNVSSVTVTGDASPKVSSLTNTATEERKYVGGLVGEVSTLSTFDYCHIINTTINVTASEDYTYTGGAFGYVHHGSSNSCKIRNSTVESCSIYSKKYTGGLIGYLDRGRVSNNKVGYDNDDNERKCVVAGPNGEESGEHNDCKGGLLGQIRRGYATDNIVFCEVKGKDHMGGLIGYMSLGEVTGNSASGEVILANQYGGGLIGTMAGGTVTSNGSSCSVTGSGSTYVFEGGLVGKVTAGTISKCYATGNISSDKATLGGLVGEIAGDVSVLSSYASGNIAVGNTKYTYRGGLVGNIASGTVSISNCYATGDVEAYRWCAGLIGSIKNDGVTVENCYTSCSLVFSSTTQSGVFIGNAGSKTVTYSGIIACNTAGLARFIYNTDVTAPSSDNYFGTTDNINTQAIALGWDSILDGSSKAVWDLTWGDNRPHLAWEPKP